MNILTYELKNKYLRICILGIHIHVYYGSRYISWVKRILRRRMENKVKTIRTKIKNKQKVRVGFLVSEQSKWGYQSVYDAFAQDSRFEPVILVTKLQLEHKGCKTYYKTMDDCVDFFKDKKLNVEIAYDNQKKQYIPINKLDIDILFYQQPWELDVSQHPIKVSKYAITGYTSYGFDLMDYVGSYMESFHRWIDYMFTVSDETLRHIQNIAKDVSNVNVAGCTKLDAYIDIQKRNTCKPIIIYAPHHSFEEFGLNLATFQYNGKEILELARLYKDKFHWVFKPHPRLKHAAIINNVMSAEEIEDYYNAWEDIGELCESGDYIDLFKNSTALITDCCSFLGEYLPSGNPVFHLRNKQAKFNSFAENIISSYYTINDVDELVAEFKRVVINKEDDKKINRLNKIPLIFDPNEKSGMKIYKICTHLLH